MEEGPVHQSLAAFEQERGDPIEHGVRLCRGQGRDSVRQCRAESDGRHPCAHEPAARTGAPVSGNDMKTGQTLIETIIAPGLKARMSGVRGWYSPNILGNRDGEVLDDSTTPRASRLVKRAGRHVSEWLSFYFTAPMHAPEIDPEHDLFIQLMKLKNTLRYLKGEELVTYLGREYYD
jgi:hypothetical protein